MSPLSPQTIPLRPIAQDELERLLALRNQIKKLRKLYDRQAQDILLRLQAGSSVEPGTHTAEYSTERLGDKLVVRLLIG